jgi:predicted HTH domain antitoxin
VIVLRRSAVPAVRTARLRIEAVQARELTTTVSLGRGTRIAGVSVSKFIDHLGARGIPVARYSPFDLEEELDRFGF